jgi:hypothetical protein
MSNYIVVKTAGHPKATLGFWPRSACGEILDGVGFNHGGEGGWVISFKDLERLYKTRFGCP